MFVSCRGVSFCFVGVCVVCLFCFVVDIVISVCGCDMFGRGSCVLLWLALFVCVMLCCCVLLCALFVLFGLLMCVVGLGCLCSVRVALVCHVLLCC